MDYALLGSLIEHDWSSADCMAFHRKNDMSEDATLRLLSDFAFWTAAAKCERLAGRIQAAQLAELAANEVYLKLPKENRW